MIDQTRNPSVRRLRVGVMYDRFGPYHVARLEAAQKRMDVVGLEVCGSSSVYAWDKMVAPCSFQRVTLFPDRASETLSLGELRTAYTQFDRFQLDAMGIHGWAVKWALMQMEWCLRSRVPMILMGDSTEWDFPRTAFKEWVKRRLIALCAAGFVAGAPHAAYVEKLGIPGARIFTGWDVVDNGHFTRGAGEARRHAVELRARLGLPGAYFLASARFVAPKNLPALLQAYARYRQLALRSGGPPWSLVLLGDGPLKPEISRGISGLGLADSVVLPGFRQYDELPVYYGLAGAFVHGSVYEPWGLVVNEAMSAGLPVLVSRRCGCAGDLVEKGVNGFTFDPLDTAAWAEGMLRLSSDPAATSAMGAKSLEIIGRWSPDRWARSLLSAAEVALDQPFRPPLSSLMVLRAALHPMRWSIPSISPTQ